MPVETPSLFAQVIKDHLELKERNSDLDRQMPIERYKSDDPFDNHPLFKTEEQARLEETMDGVQPDFVAQTMDTSISLPWPGEETAEKCPPARSRIPVSGRSIAPATSTGEISFAGAAVPGPPLVVPGTEGAWHHFLENARHERQVVDERRHFAVP